MFLDEPGFSGALVVAVTAPDVFVVLGVVVVTVMVMVAPAALVDVPLVLDVSVTAPALLDVVVVVVVVVAPTAVLVVAVVVVVAPPAVLVVVVVVVVGAGATLSRGGERDRLGRRSGRGSERHTFFGAMPTESEPDHKAKGQAAQGQRPNCEGGWGGGVI